MIFTSDEVTHWQITSQVTKKLLFTVTIVLFYFLHTISCPKHRILLKTSSIAHFAIVAKDDLFWLSIVMSPQLLSDIMGTRFTSTVMSYSSIVLAKWRKGYLHKWIATMNIDFSLPGIHCLACENRASLLLYHFSTLVSMINWVQWQW